MNSKEILPEKEREEYLKICLENPPFPVSLAKTLLSALEAAEQEIQDKQNAHLDGIIERDEQIRKHISRIQDLEKEIKNYKTLAKDNVPELVKLLKNRK